MMRRSVDLENWQKLPEATLLTIGEVAEILRVSPNQIRNAIRAGLLRARRLKGRGRGTYRVEKRAVTKYLHECEIKSVARRCEGHSRQDEGSFFKHLKPTWLHDTSRR